jgi:hypothetical protein
MAIEEGEVKRHRGWMEVYATRDGYEPYCGYGCNEIKDTVTVSPPIAL